MMINLISAIWGLSSRILMSTGRWIGLGCVTLMLTSIASIAQRERLRGARDIV